MVLETEEMVLEMLIGSFDWIDPLRIEEELSEE